MNKFEMQERQRFTYIILQRYNNFFPDFICKMSKSLYFCYQNLNSFADEIKNLRGNSRN